MVDVGGWGGGVGGGDEGGLLDEYALFGVISWYMFYRYTMHTIFGNFEPF